MKPHACPHCVSSFEDENGLYQHARAKHGQKAARALRPMSQAEPSLADELIEAQVAFAGGEQPPEHLRLMFPDLFR